MIEIDNILISDEVIETACKDSGLEDFLKEVSLDYVVGQNGAMLSGGQKQRLSIARTLIGKPDILIFDDSSSALDYATDAALRKAIRILPNNPTVFIVSQRTSSIQFADFILVLDDGRLAGKGTHEELLENCEVYREIYESQYIKEESFQ